MINEQLLNIKNLLKKLKYIYRVNNLNVYLLPKLSFFLCR